MQLIYDSFTGNTKQFALAIDCNAIAIKEMLKQETCPPCILITRTAGFGSIPRRTIRFLNKHKQHVIGVVVSGDVRYKQKFALAAPKIAQQYQLPIILTIQNAGTDTDILTVQNYIKNNQHAH